MAYKDPVKRAEYEASPERTAQRAGYEARTDIKTRRAARAARPEVKAQKKTYSAGYNARPEVTARRKDRRGRPETKTQEAGYRARPEVKVKKKAYHTVPENKKRARFLKIFKMYGVTQDDYERRLEAQQHLCPICKDALTGRIYVDHNHTTNVVRELLCVRCNVLLGMGRESAEILAAAIQYLKKHASVA